jgi:hypothetical protein
LAVCVAVLEYLRPASDLLVVSVSVMDVLRRRYIVDRVSDFPGIPGW